MNFLSNLAPSMRMRHTLTSILLAATLGWSGLYAQQSSLIDYLADVDRKYGSDADLVNGEKYYYPYRQSQGDPFLYPEPRPAVIQIHDKEFSGQQLRYDIFNQQLILDFQDLYGATNSLVLRDLWVKAFAFENKEFVRMKGPEGQDGYFQLVSGGQLSCVYKWSKNYQLNLNSGVQSYYFTEANKVSYLVIGGQFYLFRSNRSFLRSLDPGVQKTVKQFMKQGKVKVNKASDSQMRHLVEYCNSLYHEDS
jgi:hypothetical protein